MKFSSHYSSKDSFTLVELLVVIGILAILTAAVVIVLNPAELLKQSRDSKRTTDLANLNNAIKLLLTQNPDISLGSASTVYISLADSSSTCGSYALPAPPAGWKYQCAASANYQKADGSGWVPVNFGAAGGIASLPSLPVDPTNALANGFYYSYVPGGSWALTALMESEKGAASAIDDGGMMPGVLEQGTDLSLTPPLRDRGLAGYWSFDEGSGSTAYDVSGNGNNGTIYGSPFRQSASGCKRGGCISFDGIDDYISIPNASSLNANAYTIVSYAYPKNLSGIQHIALKSSRYYLGFSNANPRFGHWGISAQVSAFAAPQNQWIFLASSFDGATLKLYINGNLYSSMQTTSAMGGSSNFGIGSYIGTGEYFNGVIDDVRLYNRALSDAEIQVIYNATK